jgi:hypothetical protein
MRSFHFIACLLSLALMLGGCAASDKMEAQMEKAEHGVVDKLPEWAGGPGKGLPPRPTDPGYAAYEREVEGKEAAPKPTTQPGDAAHSSSDAPDQQTTGN